MPLSQNGIREIVGRARARLLPARGRRLREPAEASSMFCFVFLHYVSVWGHLVHASDVVLPERAAQALVDAVGRPSEAVLAAGPAPRRFGCVHGRRKKEQENHENANSLHGAKCVRSRLDETQVRGGRRPPTWSPCWDMRH